MDIDELSTALTFSLAIAPACASAWFAQALAKELQASGRSFGKPWRWWSHAVAFVLFVNVLMLFHDFAVGTFVPALLCALLAFAFRRAPWPSQQRRRAYLAVGTLSASWLALGAYELVLGSWKETIVGAPIRTDLVCLFGPLLYYSSLKVYWAYSSAFLSTSPS